MRQHGMRYQGANQFSEYGIPEATDIMAPVAGAIHLCRGQKHLSPFRSCIGRYSLSYICWKNRPVVRNPLKQVIIMAIVISIYSAILAVGVWQQNQNDKVNRYMRG